MTLMTESTQHVLDLALKLPPDERAVIAAELWASLQGETDPDVEAAWAEEIRRRLTRVESGEDPTVPWEEVRARLRAKFGR